MEAPTSLFSGTNLEMATTTCLAPPCHLVMLINLSSASIYNVFTHYLLFASHFCSFIVTVLLLFSLSHSSPWSSSTSTLSPNQQCTSLAHVHTPMLLMCCAFAYFHVCNQKKGRLPYLKLQRLCLNMEIEDQFKVTVASSMAEAQMTITRH